MPTQTFRTSKSFSTALTHIARLRFKGNDDKRADGHVLSSDNVRQKISPFANVGVMEPETLLEPAQLDFAEFVPDTAAPEPVLTMAQPTISPTTNRNTTPKAI